MAGCAGIFAAFFCQLGLVDFIHRMQLGAKMPTSTPKSSVASVPPEMTEFQQLYRNFRFPSHWLD